MLNLIILKFHSLRSCRSFRFLNMFKKIEIDIPFSEALTQMPHYEKFMNDILSKKKKIAKEGVVSLTATCSVVIQKSLPKKM